MLTVLSVALLSFGSAGAYAIADMKGKPRWGWAVATFLLSPLFFILPFLRSVGGASKPRPWHYIAGVLGGVSLVVLYGAIIAPVIEAGTLGSVPLCDSSLALDTAKEAFGGSPAGKLLGLAIVDLEHIREVSANETERKCEAMALLNNATEHPASLTIEKRGGQWLITVKLLDSLNP